MHSGSRRVRDAERKQTEDRLLALVGELNHRVKNTLATVQSIATQTLRESPTPADFVSHFEGRLQALSRAHTLLTQSNWDGTHLSDILREQLALEDDGNRIEVSGPRVRLEAQASLAVAMVIHELGVNARKHGALSHPNGRVSINWTVEKADEGEVVRLEWAERDGPAVNQPNKTGFGAALIQRSLLGVGGKTKLEFEATGVVCRIDLPLNGQGQHFEQGGQA
jgi:two-component sensor histidine kinase